MRLEVYIKPTCQLCDDALELLADAQVAHHFELTEHNILSRDDWFHRFRYTVPVVLVDGVQRLSLRFTAEELARALREAVIPEIHQ